MSADQSSHYKKTLLTRLLDGVKGCQIRFGSRSELATEDDDSVARLCAAYEDVFSHGFSKTALQSSNSKTGFWVPAALRSSEVPSFWLIIKSQLSKHESERFLLLHNVRTDVGRCRSWIRASLNEHSLERYILIILSLENLNEFYDSWAFLRDPELNSILPQTAAGLGSILFALTVDNPKLDALIHHVMEKDVPEATIQNAQDTVEIADQAILALSPTSIARLVPSALPKSLGKTSPVSSSATVDKTKTKNCKKKRRKPPVNFVSFDDDDEEPTGSLDSVSIGTTSTIFSSLPATAVSTPIEKKSHSLFSKEDGKTSNHSAQLGHISSEVQRIMSEPKECQPSGAGQDGIIKDSENDSSELSLETPPVIITTPNSFGASGVDASICSTSVKSVDCISVNSVYSDCSERLDLDSVSLAGLEVSPSQRLKPIINDAGNSVKSISGHPDFSDDLIPVPSYDSSILDLNLHVDPGFEASGSSKIQSPVTPNYSSDPVSTPNANLSRGNFDNATANQPSTDTSHHEDAIFKLKALLDREVETVATLRADVAEEKRNSSNQIKILEARIDSMSKENEILRHQLKKYVGAVQLLKREGIHRRISLEDDETEVNDSTTDVADDASHEAAEYERKLIQVAEMHGELMEFNSYLQKSIQKKDAAIRQLREELVDLRGPLAIPLAEEDDDSWDIVESFPAENRSRAATARRLATPYSNERILINIWIPSVFLTGATNDLHHVYQVFVRIKDTEWNIYRRYSQFYSLHRDLSKNDGVISSLYFPPKKHLGNKDTKFVDERRRKLQDYLRAVMNHTLQTNSILASHPEKNLLISILPFFGESFNTQTQKPKRERSRTRNIFFRQSAQSNQASGPVQPLQFSTYPQYTGL